MPTKLNGLPIARTTRCPGDREVPPLRRTVIDAREARPADAHDYRMPREPSFWHALVRYAVTAAVITMWFVCLAWGTLGTAGYL